MGQIYWTGQIIVIARFHKSADGRENSAGDLLKMRTLKNTDATSNFHIDQHNLPREA